jgi:hypothetical protein
MDAEASKLTPQQRLAYSRRALVRQIQGEEDHPPDDATHPPGPPKAAFLGNLKWSAVARGVLHRWWRRHPANAVGHLARPLLDRYAHEQPIKLVAAAAAVGALVVVVRPWRLLSITAVLAAVLKSSDVADMVTTLMQKTNATPRKDPP